MADTLTYPRPVDPSCVGDVLGPDDFGGYYEIAAVSELPDGRGQAELRPMAPAALAARREAGAA